MNTKFYLLLLFLLSFISCQKENSKEQELIIREKQLQKQEQELARKQQEQTVSVDTTASYPSFSNTETSSSGQIPLASETSTKTKYGFVVFECQIPKLEPVYESFVISSDYMKFGSKVVEIPSYSKDEEYKLLDNGELQMEQKLYAFKTQLEAEIIQRVRPYEKGDELMKTAERKYNIIKREAKIYDTYSEASIARKNMGF